MYMYMYICSLLQFSIPQSSVPVPVSAQAPIASVVDAVPLLRTSQEQLIRTLTHSKLDVNCAGDARNMTLLHHAAMVRT